MQAAEAQAQQQGGPASGKTRPQKTVLREPGLPGAKAEPMADTDSEAPRPGSQAAVYMGPPEDGAPSLDESALIHVPLRAVYIRGSVL